jgi:phosphoglucomutase
MEELRKNPLDSVAGYKTLSFCDYKTGICEDFESKKKETLDLPSANVLQFNLENNCRFIIRPSGTEPKIKFYYTVVAPTREGAKEICKEFSALAGNIAK